MNKTDHPLAMRMVTAGPGLVGRFSDVNLGPRADWAPVPDVAAPGGALAVIHVIPAGKSITHQVNAVDPASAGYLEALDAPHGSVFAAGRP